MTNFLHRKGSNGGIAALLYGLSWIFSYCWERGREARLETENMEHAEWDYEKKED